MELLNQRFGTASITNDELFWAQVREDAAADEAVRDAGGENTRENLACVFDRRLEELVLNHPDRNSGQAVKFLDNPDVRDVISRLLRDQVFDRIRNRYQRPARGSEGECVRNTSDS